MSRPPSSPAPSNKLEYQLKYQKIDAVVTITKTVIKYAALVVCVGFLYLSVKVLSADNSLNSSWMTPWIQCGAKSYGPAKQSPSRWGKLGYKSWQHLVNHQLDQRDVSEDHIREFLAHPVSTWMPGP